MYLLPVLTYPLERVGGGGMGQKLLGGGLALITSTGQIV